MTIKVAITNILHTNWSTDNVKRKWKGMPVFFFMFFKILFHFAYEDKKKEKTIYNTHTQQKDSTAVVPDKKNNVI